MEQVESSRSSTEHEPLEDEDELSKDCSAKLKLSTSSTPLPLPKETTLTETQVQEILARQDGRKVTPFMAQKLEKEAKKNWDMFYKRNETRFFKDRMWTLQEFEEILGREKPTLLEVGCGCGNFIYPMLEKIPELRVLACDFSPRAVDFVKSHENYDEGRILAFVCDITEKDCFRGGGGDPDPAGGQLAVQHNVADFLSVIFVLSSISPGEKQTEAIRNFSKAVKVGGIVFFRDYGRYDMAQLRFKGGKKIDENFYTRNDGTRVYYFTPDEVTAQFESVGFQKLQCEYVHRHTINIKEGVNVERTFVQGKFIKTANVV